MKMTSMTKMMFVSQKDEKEKKDTNKKSKSGTKSPPTETPPPSQPPSAVAASNGNRTSTRSKRLQNAVAATEQKA